MPIPMPLAQKRALCDAEVTLNGERATISGCLNDFATVTQLPNGLRAEFAWQTVERIVNNGGNFRA